jgi:hypothetical protein
MDRSSSAGCHIHWIALSIDHPPKLPRIQEGRSSTLFVMGPNGDEVKQEGVEAVMVVVLLVLLYDEETTFVCRLCVI